MGVTPEVTFASSYLTEELKLGRATTARVLKERLGRPELTTSEVGLTLSFGEDRALTAVQMLFAFGGFHPQEAVTLTPAAKDLWGRDELPVMVTEVKAYCRHYAQSGDVTPAVALGALKTLSARKFYLGYTEAPKEPLRCLHAPILAVQKYKLRGQRQPTHLRIALTPVLLQGVYPEAKGFKAKPKLLHARLLALSGAKAGRPPEQLLRLISWVLIQKVPTVQVTDQTLAERLRSQTLQHGQVTKFRQTVGQYFAAAKQLGFVDDALQPAEKTGGKWIIKVKSSLVVR